MNKIVVYTDGSSMGNGRPDSGCGWACKVMYKGETRLISGRAVGKTNNQMEMTAVLMAMRSIENKEIPVEVYSDSSYVVNTLNGFYRIKKNQDLWEKLLKEKEQFRDISFTWVKGHDLNEHNIEVDRIATEEAWKVHPDPPD